MGGELLRAGPVGIPSGPKDPALCPIQDPTGGAHPLFLAGHEGLEAWGHTEAQLVDVGGLLLAMDLHSDASLKRCLVCTVAMGTLGNPCRAAGPGWSPQTGPPSLSLHTCLSPDGQVFLLLDVQHDLQATAHAPCPTGQRTLWICVEGVTLPIASIDLRGEREEERR